MSHHKYYNDQAVQVAQRFLQQHQGEHLSSDRQRLIDRAAQHLTGVFEISLRAATEIAIKVWGELQVRGARWHIDLDRTTPQVLVLESDDHHHTRVLTVDELLAPPSPRFYGVDPGTDLQSYQQLYLNKPIAG